MSFRIIRALVLLTLFAASALTVYAQSSVITTYAGPALPVSGSSALTQEIDSPTSLALDGTGGLYVAVARQNRVYRVTKDGALILVAGISSYGFGGDGGPAVSAQLASPSGVAVDAQGNVYIADTNNNRIRRVGPDGVIRTIAGTGVSGLSGDEGPAAGAQLNAPSGLTFDAAGDLYIADAGNGRVRKITPDGVIRTAASNLGTPRQLVVDASGTLYIAGGPVYKVTPDGTTTRVVAEAHDGLFGKCDSPDSFSTTNPAVCSASAVVMDRSGNLIVVDGGKGRIRQVSPDGVMSNVPIGTMSAPHSITIDSAGILYVADSNGIRRIAANGAITTLAGAPTVDFDGDGGRATSAHLRYPNKVAVDTLGNLYVTDTGNNRIRKVSPEGIITTVAGVGSAGLSGDGGQAALAELKSPSGVAVDAGRNVFIADTGNARVRRVSSDGIISTIVGTGSCCVGDLGDGGPATSAQLNGPMGLAVTTGGTLYVADSGNNRIRKLTPDGTITTVAGPAILSRPGDVALDSFGNIYIADSSNFQIRRVTPAGVMSTVAGLFSNGSGGFAGDGGPATAARFAYIDGIAIDAAGDIYAADGLNWRIRKISRDGTVNTVVGNGLPGFSGDGGTPAAAELSIPVGVAVDAAGNLYIADAGNNRIRKVAPETLAQPQYDIASNGTASVTTPDSSSLRIGYARARASSGTSTPAGFAVFSLRQNGVLVSEASVPGSQPIQSGRIYAELSPFVRTGIAIANPNLGATGISFFFTDDQGRDFGAGTMNIEANAQISRFLDEAPFNLTNTSARTFTFSASAPVAVIALRGLTNERSEFLVTTLPVAPLSSAPSGDLVFPHYANGGGWTTQVVLVNSTDQVMTGTIGGEAPYSISPRSAVGLIIGLARTTTGTGAIRITPNGARPSGFLIFAYRSNGVTVTEASVPASPIGSAFRIYAEPESGIAVTNAGAFTTTATFELTTLTGEVVGTATASLAASAHLAIFLKEFPQFAHLPPAFRGLLRVTGGSISVLGLRGRYNERGDFLIAATPAVPESLSAASDLIFPHVVQGGGYTTEMMLFPTSAGSSSGSLDFTWR